MVLKEYLFILYFYGSVVLHLDNDDYFNDEFDPNKNCKEETLLNKLMKEESNGSPIRCSKVAGKGSDMDNWRECKKDLIQKLRDMCNWRSILEVGTITI